MAETPKNSEPSKRTESWWSKNWFYTVLIAVAVIGGLSAFGLPLIVSQPFSAGDSISTLRQAILAATGGVLAILTLWENRRKNIQEKEKNDQDHTRQVHAERRARYAKAIEQLADEKAPIRLGGVYTLIKLVDEWLADEKTLPTEEERREEGQVIINSLCAYIRSTFDLTSKTEELFQDETPGNYEGGTQRFTKDQARFREEQEIRHIILSEIKKRLNGDKVKNKEITPGTWSYFEYNFSDAHFFYAVNFNNSYFGASLNFLGATFTGYVNFSEATFTGYASFSGTTFTQDAEFRLATFTRRTDFSGATFTQVIFSGATFAWTDFYGATFTHAFFIGVTFTRADFTRVSFTHADFHRATFTHDADFTVAAFTHDADFRWVTFTHDADFTSATFTGEASFIMATFTGYANFSGATFTQRADFSSATFTGEASFLQGADFRRVTFHSEPSFIGVLGKARFSYKVIPEDYRFEVDPDSPCKIETEEKEYNGVKFRIPKGAILFDPDGSSEQKDDNDS
ncbi:pentapeptide repeat-containing protein [Rothia dentocariosa]|uniref:pentapeptide repeat-containing protein n=1 Tax=Rothia dentocariosa TaxID=2047 RepID=UPI0024486C72|nr:pentapeptide repeat-containing protein [Rothia dentocariosa]